MVQLRQALLTIILLTLLPGCIKFGARPSSADSEEIGREETQELRDEKLHGPPPVPEAPAPEWRDGDWWEYEILPPDGGARVLRVALRNDIPCGLGQCTQLVSIFTTDGEVTGTTTSLAHAPTLAEYDELDSPTAKWPFPLKDNQTWHAETGEDCLATASPAPEAPGTRWRVTCRSANSTSTMDYSPEAEAVAAAYAIDGASRTLTLRRWGHAPWPEIEAALPPRVTLQDSWTFETRTGRDAPPVAVQRKVTAVNISCGEDSSGGCDEYEEHRDGAVSRFLREGWAHSRVENSSALADLILPLYNGSAWSGVIPPLGPAECSAGELDRTGPGDLAAFPIRCESIDGQTRVYHYSPKLGTIVLVEELDEHGWFDVERVISADVEGAAFP